MSAMHKLPGASSWGDGPHPITETRRWLVRQLLDNRLSDTEVYSIVAYHPVIQDARDETKKK
jgi:hypothetical protein